MKSVKILFVLLLLFSCAKTKEKEALSSWQYQIPTTPYFESKLLEPDKTAIIIVDMWNSHWCMTAAQRVSAMVPRMNRVLETARNLGMQIVWNPSDVVTTYSGESQYERALAVEKKQVPKLREDLKVTFSAPVGECLCGSGLRCAYNYGWNAMHPDLIVSENDFISASTDDIYSLLTEKGFHTIIYMGVHTNMCVFGKPGALSEMWKAGFSCLLAQDLNDAFSCYLSKERYTPDIGTAEINENLRTAGIPLINMGEEFRKAGLWKDETPVDYVRFSPWGKTQRPYFFETSTIVSLTAPWFNDVEIRYTLDGSQPTAHSDLYTSPLTISKTTTIHAAAFKKGKQCSLISDAYYVLLPAQIPPLPDVYLDDLTYILNDYLKSVSTCFWYPQKNKSFEGKNLCVRSKIYEHGMGFRAPSSVQYEIKPEYQRFVALAGIDENLLEADYGRFIANNSSVIFRVFIDGKKYAESPVMLISQEPWRFDIAIPKGSRYLSISCTDAGNYDILDYGNWVNAGFVVDIP